MTTRSKRPGRLPRKRIESHATGKEDRVRPRLFPVAGRARAALHWGRRRRPRRGIWDKCGLTPHFAGSALGASHKMLRSPCRAQGLSERQRVRNRSELRLLAYPEPGYRRRLPTWKKNGRCVAPARVRRANQYSTTVFTRWRSLKPCARQGERSILWEAPQGRSGKMWSEVHICQQMPPDAPPWPQCSATRARPTTGKRRG